MDKLTINNIAIIDDGINEKLYKIGELEHNLQITPELNIQERASYNPYLPSHGTICAAIIKKYAPDANLSSVKILNEDSHMGMKSQLIRALEWCVQNKIRLVNLSLGTIDFKDFVEVEKAVKYACENDVIIIAACNNRNIFTCPASLPYVIGVKCDISGIIKEREYLYNSFSPDGIDITACGVHKLEKYNGESKITSACNSFATPYITSQAYYIIKNNPSICLNELKELLKKKSQSYTKSLKQYMKISNQQIKSNKHNIGSEQSNRKQKLCNFMNKNIDVPIVATYNYCCKKIDVVRNLTESFRINGYNAISISEGSQEDLCNGRVSIKSYLNCKNNSFNESIQRIFNIYDPDIIIMQIEMTNVSQEAHWKEIESHLEVDIKIHIYENLNVKVMSGNDEDGTNVTKTFTYLNAQQIDDLYNYILSLFDIK